MTLLRFLFPAAGVGPRPPRVWASVDPGVPHTGVSFILTDAPREDYEALSKRFRQLYQGDWPTITPEPQRVRVLPRRPYDWSKEPA